MTYGWPKTSLLTQAGVERLTRRLKEAPVQEIADRLLPYALESRNAGLVVVLYDAMSRFLQR